MAEQINDPVFGTLTLQSGSVNVWKKQEHLELMGGPIALEIHADTHGPTEVQRQVYLEFKRVEKGLRAELQEALFEFYRNEREFYAEVCGDIEGYIEEFLPVLQNSDTIWEILTPDSWLILGPETSVGEINEAGDKCDVMLFWLGCWDVEHEFGALFKGGELLGIQSHGDLLSPLNRQSPSD